MRLFVLIPLLTLAFSSLLPSLAAEKPNIIFILADDLGYGELGSFGQEKIKTPELDKLAANGMRLTDFYAGSTVCAPSRSVLMTGQHTGRTWVRGNGGADAQTLRHEDITVAEKLKEAGYATALIGKWGLGEIGSTGEPNKQGFDYCYGYLNQGHAHNYYPTFLYRNGEKIALKNVVSPHWLENRGDRVDNGAGYAADEHKVEYSHDLFANEALTWIADKGAKEDPFFLYMALTIPHANNEAGRMLGDGQEVPDYGIYEDKEWPDPDKGQAAMVTRMDRDVGRIVKKLEELGISENTLIIFSSDNGHHKEGGNDPELFDANGPLRGMKRDLTEGGIRVPTVASWPGTIQAGTSSDHPATFADFMATACELAGVDVPADTQSTSFVATLKGQADEQKSPEYLYWEFYEKGSKQAVRFGEWKAIREPIFTGDVQLYHLEEDIGEKNNLAKELPLIVARAIAFMEEAHVPNPNWKPRPAKR